MIIDGSYPEGTFFQLGDRPVTLFFSTDSQYEERGFQLVFMLSDTSPGKLNSINTNLAIYTVSNI